MADQNPPPPPQPEGHAVYLHQLFRDPVPRRVFLHCNLQFFCRALTYALFALIAVISVVILGWLIFHPYYPQLHVASATLSAVNITNTSAKADCAMTFRFTNPNRHLAIIYDRMEISLVYPFKQVTLSQDYRMRFSQPKKSRITIESNLSFSGVGLGTDVVKAMKEDLDGGSLNLGIKILGYVRYRNVLWKTKSQLMRAYCVGVSFGFPSTNKSGIFLNPYIECDVYVYMK